MTTIHRPAWDLWIDYTAREPSGRTPTLRRYAAPGVEVLVGSYLVVGAEDAELAVAEVVEVDEHGVVMVRVLPGPVDEHRHLVTNVASIQSPPSSARHTRSRQPR